MMTVKFYTLGCKVNQYETQYIRERFQESGFRETQADKSAQVYVINTCTVTSRSDTESLNLIRRAKRENPKAIVIVTGCLAEADTERITESKAASLIVKNKDKGRTLDYLFPLLTRQSVNKKRQNKKRGITYFKDRIRAFLKIQDGCNKFCSYCKVPLVRGTPYSKPLNDIIREAKDLARNGFQEIVLCGICLGLYGRGLRKKISLIDVVCALEDIPGIKRIRLSSIEPEDLSLGLIRKMEKSGKLCKHLHIPLQSGDDKILRLMRRRYSSTDYLNLIKKIKRDIPDIAITTDVLVGFPGETEAAFRNTVDVVQEILPLKVHIFPYSLRLGTAAVDFGNRLGVLDMKKRIARIRAVADECASVYQKKFLNRVMSVLIEGRVKDDNLLWEGHTENYIKVLVASASELKNQIVNVKLTTLSRCPKEFCIQGEIFDVSSN